MARIPAARWQALGYEPNEWALEHVHGRDEQFIAVVTGRQTGKTTTEVGEIDIGMNTLNLYGKAPWVGVLAPSYEKAELPVERYIEYINATFGGDGVYYNVNRNKHRLQLIHNGATLQWFSSDNPYSVVGPTLSRLIVEEAEAVPDVVFEKISPTLDVLEAPMRAFGTADHIPQQSWFRAMILRGENGEPDHHTFRITSEAAGWMSPEAIEAARLRMSEREFRRLYLAEDVDEEGRVFPKAHIDRAISNFTTFDPKIRHIMSVDFAIKEDYTVVMVGRASDRQAIFMDRWNKTDPMTTYDRVGRLWEEFGRPNIVADGTGGSIGEPMIEELRKRGMRVRSVQIKHSTKMPMVMHLAADIEHRRVMFPDWPDLKRELSGFVFMETPGGNRTAGSSVGYHDDCVWALILLNEGFRSSAGGSQQPYSYAKRGALVGR